MNTVINNKTGEQEAGIQVAASNPFDAGNGDSSDDALILEATDWFIRLQAAEGDPTVSRAFRAWLDSDPERAAAFGKVNETWGSPEFLLASRNVATNMDFRSPDKAQRSSLAKKIAVSVAVLVFAVALSQMVDFVGMRSDYVTAAGERQIIILPDGSKMTMNTSTAVAVDFNDGRRSVRILRGEAYFDVRPKRSSPFEVLSPFSRVEVTGTAFAVRHKDDADNVVLSRGSVEVALHARPADHAELAPGQMISATATALSPVTRVNVERSLAWLDGRISFSDQPLGQVLDDLRRYYPGRIFVSRRSVEEVAVSGSYRLDNPLMAIQALVEAAGGRVSVLPGGIVIVR